MEKSMRQAAEAAIDSALLKLKPIEDKTLGISSKIVPGPPSQAIVDEAESWGADLIVMGSRGQGTWGRLLLGSVSSAVVHHATCSVEIVRKPQNK
jgi:nucleotide-binding universal stress UspA family protein